MKLLGTYLAREAGLSSNKMVATVVQSDLETRIVYSLLPGKGTVHTTYSITVHKTYIRGIWIVKKVGTEWRAGTLLYLGACLGGMVVVKAIQQFSPPTTSPASPESSVFEMTTASDFRPFSCKCLVHKRTLS